jgi:hypothetical protein
VVTGDPMGDPYSHGYGYGGKSISDPVELFLCRRYVYEIVIPGGYLPIAISRENYSLHFKLYTFCIALTFLSAYFPIHISTYILRPTNAYKNYVSKKMKHIRCMQTNQ